MRKLLVVVLVTNFILKAQSQNLTAEGTAPDLYLTHTVAPKENFYRIARLYNQPPKSIASYNQIVMEKGLTIGQKVKIPLNAQNFDVSGSSTGSGQTLIPITHIVAKNETLFKIAGNNNATAELIRKWNNLSSDNIAPGTALVIGHLKVNGAQAPVSTAKNEEVVSGNKPSEASKSAGATANESAPDATKEEMGVSADTASTAERNEKQQGSVKTETGENEPVVTASLGKDTALAVMPEETKQSTDAAVQAAKEKPENEKETPQKKTSETSNSGSSANASLNLSEGAFAKLFGESVSKKSLNTKSGEAATFKSTSGWQDKKYYVLMSNVTPGTILKISAAENKVVYAKVLGSMPEMKENEGLLLRISNAAASSLGIIDPKFPVQISYYQ